MTNATRSRATWTLFHAVVLIGSVSYGSWRYDRLQFDRALPIPQNEPRSITPRHQRPDLVSREEASRILTRLQPRFRGRNPKINSVEHALRLWGVEARSDDETALSGAELRELLLDHRAFAAAWGPKAKPFVIPDTRDTQRLMFRTDAGNATSSHVDHTLACLGEVGTPLDFPVITPRGESTVGRALAESLRQFSLNQDEYEWSALVYLLYLPETPEWTSTEGQRITWDRLAERLMRQRLAQGVCYGQHRLYTLAALLRVDEESPRLSPRMRQRAIEFLQHATAALVKTQHAEGWWAGDWPGIEPEGSSTAVDGPFGPQADRLLMTGHVLEWWAYAPEESLPNEETLTRAVRWLIAEIDGLSNEQVQRYYPFLTHAGRALALWHGAEPQALIETPR
ncbi:MAG TPA: hypothetical protein VFG20_05825 [Planctomycetaceae bacterium]|nr:hypothetical protein [Planctomycetaceae bacterium]